MKENIECSNEQKANGLVLELTNGFTNAEYLVEQLERIQHCYAFNYITVGDNGLGGKEEVLEHLTLLGVICDGVRRIMEREVENHLADNTPLK